MTPRSLRELADAGEMDPGWAAALAPAQDTISALGDFLRAETAAGRGYLPAGHNVLRAFRTPFDAVRVLVVGQDPYPTPGHSIGLAFAVEPHVRPVPRSLANIYRELRDDVGIEPPAHGDLSPWANQGVLLLNRVLTVQPGESGSHRRKGWESVTELAIRALASRGRPLVSVLWGRDAAAVEPLLGGTPAVTSAHPSPLSASRGFFGSRPFSRVNALLLEQGEEPIDWALPPAA
jgi:uracil-DNA glycosylase